MREEVEQPFDYDKLDKETRAYVQQKTMETHVLLTRTAEHIIQIGQNLLEVQRHLPNMKFSAWLRSEFDLSRRTAYNFMKVATKFGESCATIAQLPAKVLYELASSSDEIIQQVEKGDLLPNLEAIRSAKEAEQEALQQQLVQEREAAAVQIGQLSQELEALQQQLAQLRVPPEPQIKEVPVVPPEVSAQLETLRGQVATLTTQREVALRRVAELGEQVQAMAAKREVEQYAREICLAWSNATSVLHTSLLKFIAQLPTPQQTQVFVAGDWNRLTRAQAMLQRVQDECKRLRQDSQGMVVEAMPGTSSTNDKVGRDDRTTST